MTHMSKGYWYYGTDYTLGKQRNVHVDSLQAFWPGMQVLRLPHHFASLTRFRLVLTFTSMIRYWSERSRQRSKDMLDFTPSGNGAACYSCALYCCSSAKLTYCQWHSDQTRIHS